MSSKFSTEQEAFWAQDFGDKYTVRNDIERGVAQRIGLYSDVLRRTGPVTSALELGANIGDNLRALRTLLPSVRLGAVEINETARQRLREINGVNIFEGSITDFEPSKLGTYEITFTSGVLIHINPDLLPAVYDRLYECSEEWIMVNEYYNPTPVSIPYRGHEDRLFKRDFAGEILDRFNDLELVDYGFLYHRDPVFPSDDTTWFLLRRTT